MALPVFEGVVRPEWIDSNGHMNLACFIVAFDLATDALFDALDIGAAYRARTGSSSFVVETHTLYERELREGAPFSVHSRLLGVDDKRLHFAHEMRAGDGARAALHELLCIHIDMGSRRAAPWPAATRARLAAALAAETGPVPPGVGRRVGDRRGGGA
ncbi:MAG: thioesterase family protein [Acetobacteraceae bacterium]